MNIVQYGLVRLAKKLERDDRNRNYGELIRMLAIIGKDTKEHDISEEFVKGFMAEVDQSTSKIQPPRLLLLLWREYKKRGGLVPL
jgi:hypothetical protein